MTNFASPAWDLTLYNISHLYLPESGYTDKTNFAPLDNCT